MPVSRPLETTPVKRALQKVLVAKPPWQNASVRTGPFSNGLCGKMPAAPTQRQGPFDVGGTTPQCQGSRNARSLGQRCRGFRNARSSMQRCRAKVQKIQSPWDKGDEDAWGRTQSSKCLFPEEELSSLKRLPWSSDKVRQAPLEQRPRAKVPVQRPL